MTYPPLTVVQTGDVAAFSWDRTYRYFLRRRCGFGEKVCTFIMLNPSTADETHNDATITRCIGFAKSWGYGWLYITNLSPFRATDPKAMIAHGHEPVGVEASNLQHILDAADVSDLIMVAYGVGGVIQNRAEYITDELLSRGHDLYCLALTKDGYPHHPLRIPSITQPQLYKEHYVARNISDT